MRTLSWLGRVSLVPAIGVALLVWWVAAALGRGAYDMSAWAALLLFGGLALSRATPRVAVIALYGAFALQLVRAVCRFDQEGWVAYAAIPLAAVVYGATTETHRRGAFRVLLSLGLLTGLFTNIPALGRIDYFSSSDQPIYPQSYWGLIDGMESPTASPSSRAPSASARSCGPPARCCSSSQDGRSARATEHVDSSGPPRPDRTRTVQR